MGHKDINDALLRLADSTLMMAEAMRPPTDARLSEILSTMDDVEVYGLYKWGSKKGRRLAKIECLNRGLITPSFFKWLLNKFK